MAKHVCDGTSYSRPNMYGCKNCKKRFPSMEALLAEECPGKEE